MKGIIVTIFAMVFMATISVGQSTGTVQKAQIKAKPATFKAEDGPKKDKKRKKVRVKFKAEKQKKNKKTKVKFKAEDADVQKKKTVKTDF